ncbi:1880_t:CDS:2, partial [Gigaspora margarita]
YTCVCGNSYVIASYGQAVKAMRCPGCKNNVIDCAIYLSVVGNQKLDKTQITEPIKYLDQPGYIGEQINNMINHSVRTMSPSSYRILHLIVHYHKQIVSSRAQQIQNQLNNPEATRLPPATPGSQKARKKPKSRFDIL